MDMHSLYESDVYLVVHMAPNEPGAGIEIVNKQTERETYLTGSDYLAFQQVCLDWKVNTPTAEEVEAHLDSLLLFYSLPLVAH